MKLIYRGKPSGLTGKGQTPIISWWDKEFCCSRVRAAWELQGRFSTGLIGLDESGIVVKRDGRVSLHWKEVYENDVEHEYYPIEYCPFCGQAMEYIFPSDSMGI